MGKPRSPEVKARIQATMRERMADPAVRAKLSASHTGKTLSAETRAKISAARKGKSVGKGRLASDATKAKMSATNKARWADPAYRAKCLLTRVQPVRRCDNDWPADRIALLTTLWADASLSASAIGRRIGLSKSAVLAKSRRLELPRRASPIHAEGRAPNRLSRQANFALRTERVAAAAAIAAAYAALPTAPRERHCGPASDCQWPTTVGGRHRLECSNPCEGRRPYCVEHGALAYGRPQLGQRVQDRLVAAHG